ncbi:hypothetical protein [Frigoriflavimonas asaccharolytica]|uniref:Uncharacterized protein n=1 Tax=Frigoriflavimonas asaccharolytica TaxID=2735899 RepID=A0A8J8K8Z6_9FLAO|nr:hypothetical protein [Frigoriflavimonas asaccharolytica]NRS93393.1 hypothetical protein [Frigoriflavimonas asaccharolytica]
MNKNTQVIFASSFGLAVVLGLMAVRNYFRDKDYEKEYGDFHRNFG